MGKSYKIILAVLLVLLAALVFLEANQKDPLNWFPSYSTKDKIPLGTYVFFESLNEKLKVEEVNIPPFEFLKDSTSKGTYFFLNGSVGIDKTETNRLLNWVQKGNTAIISANGISLALLDTLQITTNSKIRTNGLDNFPAFNFTNPNLKSEYYYEFDHDQPLSYFDSLNGTQQKVLGFGKLKDDSKKPKDSLANFIESKFGNGKFLLHTSPQAFSNYFMLKDKNFEYAEKFLAYIDVNSTIYWDNHYKNGKTINTSPLYILLGNKYLKWAYYFVLIAAVLFVFFEGKRKQKPIKIVNPLRNQTYDYTRTIAGMYLDNKEYRTIYNKMTLQFFDYLKKELKVDVEKQKNHQELLADRTQNSSEEIKELFSTIKETQVKTSITKKDIEKLNRLIIQFKKNK